MEAAAEEAAAAVATVAAHRMPPARRPMPLQQNPPCDSRSASRSRSSEFSSVTTAGTEESPHCNTYDLS